MGLGRAVVWVREHGPAGLEDEILRGCLHCWAIEPVEEGTRVGYMMEVLKHVPDPERYHAAVVESLASAGDDWDGVQRFVFAAELGAREEMYQWLPSGGKMAGRMASPLVWMDRLPGLLRVAGRLEDRLPDRDLLTMAFNRYGEAETWAALRGCPEAAAFHARAQELMGRRDDRRRIVDTTYAELRARMTEAKPHEIGRWGEMAGDKELARAAAGLLTERDPELVRRHLWIFEYRAFPLDPAPLFAIGKAAALALAQISDPRVPALLMEWFQAAADRHEQHDIEIALRTVTGTAGLLHLYEHGPCSVCREFVYKDLDKLRAVTARMRAEWPFDSCMI